MPPASPDRPRSSRTSRAVALVALASLSCTTVRVPASSIPDSVRIRGDVAEPQVELWVESGKDVTPAEAARAAADARAAIEQALAGRALGDGGQLLVVRAQGVIRTGSRKTDQAAAVAGIVVASVAIVAVAVVVLVAAAKGGGGKAPSAHAPPAAVPRPAPAPPAVATPAPVGAIARPPPGTAHPVVPAPARPAPGPGGAGVGFAFGANVQIGVPAEGPPPAVWGESVVTGPAPAPPGPEAAAEPGTAEPVVPVPWTVEPGPVEIALPAPPPLDVEHRGFFAGDSTRLELTVVDRATMAPVRVKVVESKIDARDARAIRDLVDRALSDPEGWQTPPPAPPPPGAPGA